MATAVPRIRTRPRAPRRRLNPAFIAAVDASQTPQHSLARQAGFPVGHELSVFFNAPEIPASDLTISRLRLLAGLVGYDGPLFLEDEAQ